MPWICSHCRQEACGANQFMMKTMEIENVKLDIIDWIRRTNNKELLYKLEELRLEELDMKTILTEDQKREIINAISTLEEGN